MSLNRQVSLVLHRQVPAHPPARRDLRGAALCSAWPWRSVLGHRLVTDCRPSPRPTRTRTCVVRFEALPLPQRAGVAVHSPASS